MQAETIVLLANAQLNMVQTVALAYIAARWRNGTPTPSKRSQRRQP